MNVTHVIFNLYTGGTELMLMDIMKAQLEMGAKVNLLVVNRGYDENVLARVPAGVRLLMANRPTSSKNLWWVLRINALLYSTHPDVVHFHNDMSVGMVIKLPWVKYVGTIHDTNIKLRYSHKRLDRLFAISQAVKEDIEKRYWVKPTVVYNGIRVSDVRMKGNNPHPGYFHIVQVGRLMHEKKGQHLLLQAIAMLPMEMRKKTIVDFIGDGNSLDYLKSLSKQLGLSKNVKFLGAKDRSYIFDNLSCYDLFVQPSLYEGFGLTVAEAMAACVPVLVSELEGPLEVVDSGRMGEIFKPGNIADLSSKIKEIQNNYPAHLNLAHRDAHKWISDNFDISITAGNYLKQYEELCK